ncbi:hypothetical protein B566_EDAN007082 [Ephemera danica]|nr:hypothetical protein B566_EDAN007082 [Ephemera danica]
MPGYELSIALRVMTKPFAVLHTGKTELVATLKRTAHEILDRGGFLRQVENLGTRATPHKMEAHGQVHREASYYRLEFEAPPQLVTQLPDVLCRDVDVLRSRIYKLRLPLQQECTIFEETKPPAYRPEVQQMIEIGKRKVKKRFNPNTGLPVTPFQR